MKDKSVTGCCKACGDDSTGGWQFFTFTGSACWCHKKTGTKRPHEGYTSGSCHAQPPPGPPPSKNGVTTATGAEAAAGMPPLAITMMVIPSSAFFGVLPFFSSQSLSQHQQQTDSCGQLRLYEGIRW
eukprot:COSAG05_NODE_57_length_23291_cov_75.862668_12_plen_127_part_00